MFLNVNANVLYCSTFMKSPLLQLKRTIVSLNVGNVAHQLKTYDILLIAILPTKDLTHSLLTKEKCTVTIGNAERLCNIFLRTVYSLKTTNIAQITLHPTTYLMIPLESQNQTCHTSRELYKEHDTQKSTGKKQRFLRSQTSKDTN